MNSNPNCVARSLRRNTARRFVFAILGPLAAASTLAAATPAERYAEVCKLFEKGDFSRAQYQGESLLKEGHLSPQLFQALGHIRYRQGDLGRAALWYERASQFPPPVPEIRQNIAHIHERTGNLAFRANRLQDQFSAYFTRAQWGGLATAGLWFFIFPVAIWFLFPTTSLVRNALLLVAVGGFTVAGGAGLGWLWHPTYASVRDLAVVTAPATQAFSAATVTSGFVSALPPGSTVRKLQDRGAWTYVEIPHLDEYRRGWVPSEALTPFWPFDPGYLQ